MKPRLLTRLGPEAMGATAIYAIGVIHGRLDLLFALEKIAMRDIAKTKLDRQPVQGNGT